MLLEAFFLRVFLDLVSVLAIIMKLLYKADIVAV